MGTLSVTKQNTQIKWLGGGKVPNPTLQFGKFRLRNIISDLHGLPGLRFYPVLLHLCSKACVKHLSAWTQADGLTVDQDVCVQESIDC